MNKLSHSSLYGSVAVYGLFLLLCLISRSQNITLSWPDAPAKPPKTSSPPPATSTDAKPSNAPDADRPTDGSIKENIYTNRFFQFSLPFPEGWKVLGSDSGPAAMSNGPAYVLLMVGSPDRQLHGTRWIAISAAHPNSASGIATAEEYLKNWANTIKVVSPTMLERGQTPPVITGEPTEISIGGRRMARLDMTFQVNVQGNNYPIRGSQLAIIEQGYLVLFIISDPSGNESDHDAAAQVINSLHFFRRTPSH
jgi:hypothetical protein